MDMRLAAQARLARWAARRPHVLLIPAPGGTRQRLAVEAHLPSLGAVPARSPADADLLAVAGTPSPELGEAIERVWAQVPAPRACLSVFDPEAAAALLGAAVQKLAHDPDPGEHPGDESGSGHAAGNTGHGDHCDLLDGRDHGGQGGPGERAGQGAAQAGHEGHGGQGELGGAVAHAGHAGEDGMQMPGGLMMADRAADRDGLKLDVLHVPLGPVLPAWPAGLVVDTEMQGDVLQTVTARVLTTGVPQQSGWWADPAPERRAAAHIDSLARLLEVADWPAAAAQARRLRDQLLASGTEMGGAAAQKRAFARFAARVRRSFGLRRCLADLGRLDAGEAARLGLSGPAARATVRGGDAWARTLTWLAETAAALDGQVIASAETSRGTPGDGSTALLRSATWLMPGLGLADARLVMASLDPDTDEMAGT